MSILSFDQFFPNNKPEAQIVGELRDLEPVAKALNEESNALRDILVMLNNKLGAMNIGLEIWMSDNHTHGNYEFFSKNVYPNSRAYDRDSRPSDQHEIAWELGYAKLDEHWSIAVRPVWIMIVTNPDYDSEDDIIVAGGARAVLEAPRPVRIAAAAQISNLIDHIKETAEAGIEAIRQARKLAENL